LQLADVPSPVACHPEGGVPLTEGRTPLADDMWCQAR